MNYTVEELISKNELEERIAEVSKLINKDYEGKQISLICVLKVELCLCVNLQSILLLM